jgi:hypothetical protein
LLQPKQEVNQNLEFRKMQKKQKDYKQCKQSQNAQMLGQWHQ